MEDAEIENQKDRDQTHEGQPHPQRLAEKQTEQDFHLFLINSVLVVLGILIEKISANHILALVVMVFA